MRNIDNYLDGENRGDTGGVPNYIPRLPPAAPPPAPIPVPTTIRTGGPYPAVPVVNTLQTGGPNPPVPVQTTAPVRTGGPLPPTPVNPGGYDGSGINPNGMYTQNWQTGGPQPPVKWGGATQTPGSPVNLNSFGPAQTVEDMMNHFLNGQYAQNARQRGMETASSRGLINSNIAAGASQRAALEAVQPFVSEGMNLLNSREQRALTQNESFLDRQFRQQMQNDSVKQQDWLANNAYNREFNGNLSLVPIANSAEFMQYLFQLGAQDPEVYTPNVLAGMQNFFTQNFMSMLQNFFPKGGK